MTKDSTIAKYFVQSIATGLMLGFAVIGTATAQNQATTDANTIGKVDWSGSQTTGEVNSLSQPTRFSQRSSIPQSRTGNESLFKPKPTRERGGLVPDRLNTFTNRSEPIVR